jgi:transglutaminase-like putative cysteine protease
VLGPEAIARAGRRRREDQGAWRISIALLFCFGVVTAGLHTVLDGVLWWFGIFFLLVAVLGTAAAARATSRRRWVPTVISSLALLVILTVFFAARTALFFVIPTLGTLVEFGDLGQAGALSISSQSVPATLTFGIMFLLCLGIGALAIAADAAAATWRRPVLAGLPLAVILGIPGFIGIRLTDLFVFMLAAIAWLVLLRAGQPLRQTGRALGLGAVSVVVARALPLALPPVDESQATGDSFSGYLAGVNPVLNLGADLRRQLPRTILRYNSLTDSPTYLRLVSLQNFTAETWEPDPASIERDNRPAAIGPVPGLAEDVGVEDETTWIDVLNLGSPWLPVPYPVTGVSGLRGDWFWDADDLTLTSPDRAARGEEYRAASLMVQPTPQQLTSAGSIVPPGFGKYLDLPENLPDIIRATAAEVAGSATSNYGMAVALQEFFRDGDFTYSETAPVDAGYDGNGMQVLAKFLEAKSGYCIHFASAMAVMARTLGIPSRVAVGFLPGEKEDALVEGRASFRVTTRDVHSWPELYFEGIGWTRFEPTPGLGFVPTYADEATPGVPVPPDDPTDPTAAPTPTPTPTAIAPPVDPDGPSASESAAARSLAWLWPALILLAALLLLLAPAIVRVLQRSIRMRRLARGSPAAATGWRELLQTAEDLGVDIASTATPRNAARAIAKAAGLIDADALTLEGALLVVERQSFARPGLQASGPAQAAQVARILSRLRGAARPRARLLAALVPRSIWSRLAGLLGASVGPASVRTAAAVIRVG